MLLKLFCSILLAIKLKYLSQLKLECKDTNLSEMMGKEDILVIACYFVRI